MAEKPTLLVLAAGMASRYGSLKQTEQFGPGGETIIDYAIYDAIKAGFGKVIFVIRKSIEAAFIKGLLDKFAGKIEADYVLQELNMVPEGFSVPAGREKPWGTGHAVWVAAAKINEPFAVINGDDFYGYQSFKLMADFLESRAGDARYAMVGYRLENTLSEHGAVSRGICETDRDGNLKSVSEQTHIIRTAEGIVARTPGQEEIRLRGDETASMNLMGFTPAVFPYFKACFEDFLRDESPRNIKAEFYLPKVVNKLVQEAGAQVKVLHSPEKWFGVTFPEDRPVVVQQLQSLVAAGVYPENLWTKAHIK